MNAADLITAARQYVRAEPSAETWARVLGRKPPVSDVRHPINFFTYRCLKTADQFKPIVDHWRAMVAKFHPDCMRAVASGHDVDMFERAEAMCAFVHSDSFNAPTVFMDSDAFPNADLLPVFDSVRDIGLTYRDTPGLMPINEGVIFAQPTDAARAFFRAYLGTFEALRGLLVETDWRWWGGQLALNALGYISDPASSVIHSAVNLLPCDTYNFSPDTEADLDPAVLDTKSVIHLKGGRKDMFERVRAYQEAR